MPFYRLVGIKHMRYVQEADVEAESPEAAVLLWNSETATPCPEPDHGRIEAIEMVDVPAGLFDNLTEEEEHECREYEEREAVRQEARAKLKAKEPRFS